MFNRICSSICLLFLVESKSIFLVLVWYKVVDYLRYTPLRQPHFVHREVQPTKENVSLSLFFFLPQKFCPPTGKSKSYPLTVDRSIFIGSNLYVLGRSGYSSRSFSSIASRNYIQEKQKRNNSIIDWNR